MKETNVKDAVFELGFGPKVDREDGGRKPGVRGTLRPKVVVARPDGAPAGPQRWFGAKRTRRLTQLLTALARSPEEYRQVGTLAAATGLKQVTYPLLADLSRRGWVEHRWLETAQGPRLAYRLSPKAGRRVGAGANRCGTL